MTGSPSIRWQQNTPVSTAFDDPYYSLVNPCAEVEHTFLNGVNLTALAKSEHLVIAETGFGTGLNFLLAVDHWLRHADSTSTLTFISVEAFPLAKTDLSKAHAGVTRLPDMHKALQAQWPGPLPGIHRLSFLHNRVRLLLLFGDVLTMLKDQQFVADAWFLDGFAPAKNPKMWSDEVFTEITRLSGPSTRLASFTAAGNVRRGLQSVGFQVDRRAGYGSKRHCIEATLTSSAFNREVKIPWLRLPKPESSGRRPSIAIIGAGIAGRTLARRLKQQQFDVTTIAGPGSKAFSGSLLPRALIAPRLVRGADAYAQFWAQAYSDAICELDRLDDGYLWQGERGLLFRFREADQKNLRGLKASTAWPDEWMEFQAAEHDKHDDALFFPKSGAIDPAHLFRLLGEQINIHADIHQLRQTQDGWELIDDNKRIVCQADIVIIAAGTGSSTLLERPDGLRNGSGQLISLCPADPPKQAVLHDGYLTTADQTGRVIAGATITRANAMQKPQTSEQASTEILSRLSDYLGPVNPGLKELDLAAWAGGRCDTVDHLPMAGPVQNHKAFNEDYRNLFHGVRLATLPDPKWLSGLYAMTGLGARGFQAAFLLADHVTAMISGQPLPLGQSVTADLLPCRFQIRKLKKTRPSND